MNAVELSQRYPREGEAASTSCAEELGLPSQVDGADLAVVLALFDPGAVFVRERDGGGTSLMRREADGCWYFID
jgi:hypothetical protein